MLNNEQLRKESRLLKAFNEITYSELADRIEVSRSSFSNWLNRNYDFSVERAARLEEVISNLKGE
jgi:DNA-binding transcriptional ArsR family regulator